MSIIRVSSTPTGGFYFRSEIHISYVYPLTGRRRHIAKRFLSRCTGHEVIFERVRSLKTRLIVVKRRERGEWAMPINRVPGRVDSLLCSQVLVSLNGYLRWHCRNYFVRTTVKSATLLHVAAARRASSSPSSSASVLGLFLRVATRSRPTDSAASRWILCIMNRP